MPRSRIYGWTPEKIKEFVNAPVRRHFKVWTCSIDLESGTLHVAPTRDGDDWYEKEDPNIIRLEATHEPVGE